MSVQGEINRIKDAVSDSYSAVSDKGGETPTTQNVANLAQAIRSIPTGSDDVFIAEYGVTTYQDVLNAYNAGKACFCIKNSDSRFATLCQADSNSFRFAALSGNSAIYNFILFNGDSWLSTGSSYEYSSSRTQTISSSSTTSQYPSAKAVYDFVNEQKPVFMAEYGTTTMQEVLDAYHAGKSVKCYKDTYVYDLVSIMSSFIIFSTGYADTNYFLYLSSDSGWQYGRRTLLTTTEVTQSISTDSTATNKYPSAKAVYDYIQSLDAREVSY